MSEKTDKQKEQRVKKCDIGQGLGEGMGDIGYLLIKKEKNQSQEMALETDNGAFLQNKNST